MLYQAYDVHLFMNDYFDKLLCSSKYRSAASRDALLLKRAIVTAKNERDDVVVAIGLKRYKCRLAVLTAYSEGVNVYNWQQPIVMDTNVITCDLFEKLYEWMKLNPVVFRSHELVALYHAAECLSIKTLKNQLLKIFGAIDIFEELKVIKFYWQAFEYEKDIIAKMMLRKISKYFLPFVATANFVKMPFVDVLQLLSSKRIAVRSEIEVFVAAVRWVFFDYSKRNKYIVALMEAISFHSMTKREIDILRDLGDSGQFFHLGNIIYHPVVWKEFNKAYVLKPNGGDSYLCGFGSFDLGQQFRRKYIPEPLWNIEIPTPSENVKSFATYLGYMEYFCRHDSQLPGSKLDLEMDKFKKDKINAYIKLINSQLI